MLDLRSRVVTELGWSFEQVDNCEWTDLMELSSYWAENPPVHVLLAARYLDPKKRKKRERRQEMKKSGLTMEQAVQQVVPGYQPGTVPFDRLPPHVQQAFMDRKKEREKNANNG